MPDNNDKKTTKSDSNKTTNTNHEPGSLRDGTAELEAGANSPTRDDAIAAGRQTAEENLKSEDTRNRQDTSKAFEENIKDAQETARLNYEAEQKSQPRQGENRIGNDTSKEAKEATAKAQLDPTGNDPISSSEINKSATNASMETGNKNGLSNEEAAKRAQEPGKAEEENPFSTAGKGVTQDLQSDEVRKTGDKSTSNKRSENKNS